MMWYSVQPRYPIFIKSYGFLPSAKNLDENIGKNLRKILSGKYSQKLLDHAKQSMTGAFKTDQNERLKKKQQKQFVIWLAIKLLIQLQKFQKSRNS